MRAGIGRAAAALSALLIICLALAGCGSSSASGSGSATSTKGAAAKSGNSLTLTPSEKNTLQHGYAGIVQPPPKTGPRAVKGKTVWVIGILGNVANNEFMKAAQAAGKVLGWNVKLVDNQGSPTTQIADIKEAVAAHVDGIISLPFDCPVIKAGLLAAKQAKIPVVDFAGVDCSAAEFGHGKALFTEPLKLLGNQTFLQYYAALGRQDAKMFLSALAAQGVAHPKIIQTQNSDIALNGAEASAFTATIKADCPQCTLYPLKFTYAEVAAGRSPEIFKTGLLSHPDANALYYAWDAQLTTGGLQAAIKTAPEKFSLICCGDGGDPGVTLAHAGVAKNVILSKYPYEWAGWAGMDVMNRIFAGKGSSDPNEGTMVYYVDAAHHLPAAGQAIGYPFNYAAAYTRLWTGK